MTRDDTQLRWLSQVVNGLTLDTDTNSASVTAGATVLHEGTLTIDGSVNNTKNVTISSTPPSNPWDSAAALVTTPTGISEFSTVDASDFSTEANGVNVGFVVRNGDLIAHLENWTSDVAEIDYKVYEP